MIRRKRTLQRAAPAWLQAVQRWLQNHPAITGWMSMLRLSLFQFAVGLSLAPITGTLNRVLIDELYVPALAVSFLIAIHFMVSPIRAMIGFHSDQRRAQGHWRLPYLVLGIMLTYGGLACAPFALIILSGDGVLGFWPALGVCALIFLAYGVGVNIVETIFLALVSDLTPPQDRGRVLAVLWIMLVLGTIVSAFIVSQLLVDYSHAQLIRVMQGSAVAFVILTTIALWRQERLRPDGTLVMSHKEIRVRLSLGESLRLVWHQHGLRNVFGVLFIATAAFATHDVLLEPYGGQVLQMSVAATTQLTGIFGLAMLAAITLAGWLLRSDRSPLVLIGLGCVIGVLGFGTITYASDVVLVGPFQLGVALIGLGRGLFIVGSVALVLAVTDRHHTGLMIGLWGMLQALAQGSGVIGGGIGRDVVQSQTGSVVLGYAAVYGASLAGLVIALGLFALLHRRRALRLEAMRSPWDSLQDLPADQLVY